jgi:hypothetical protein
MKKVEVAFLASVFGVAGLFAWMSLSQVVDLYSASPDTEAAAGSTGGESRDVDLGKLQRLLQQGYLSEQEAKYYREFAPWSHKRDPNNSGWSGESAPDDAPASQPSSTRTRAPLPVADP